MKLIVNIIKKNISQCAPYFILLYLHMYSSNIWDHNEYCKCICVEIISKQQVQNYDYLIGQQSNTLYVNECKYLRDIYHMENNMNMALPQQTI